MLPSPTRDQLVATAFNRLAQQSNESGSNEVEFRYDQVTDRVKTSGLAFLGLTLDCARCHDHKFDPISQREYWQMAAFFDNIDERGIYSQYCPRATPSPSMTFYSPAQEKRRTELEGTIDAAVRNVERVRGEARKRFDAWWSANGPPRTTPEDAGWGTRLSAWLGISKSPTMWDPKPIVAGKVIHPILA
jgi:hypothetical protein